MIELPHAWRTLLVDSLDAYCDRLDGTSTPDEQAEAIIEHMEAVAVEVTGVEAEGIVSQLEDSLEGDRGLTEVLAETLRSGDALSGEYILVTVESLCEIEYIERDVDEEAAGFFDANAGMHDDF
jgi:hypothetical protein